MRADFRKKLLLSIALGAFVFIGFSIYADTGRLIDAFGRFNWAYAPLILACASANYFFRFRKYDYYTRVLGIHPGTEKNVIIFFTAFMMAVTPGKLGEVLKSYLLKEVNQTPVSRSAPVILAERLTDFIGLIVLILIGASMFGQGQTAVLLFTFFFAGLTSILMWRRGSLAIIGFVERIPLFRKFVRHLHDGYESMYQLLRPVPFLYATALSIVSWAFECFGFWLVLSVFHAPPTFMKATFIYSFSTIVGALSMLPGGLGTTEGSLTGLTMLAGATRDIAVASTFIIRIATLWFAVIVGVVVTVFFQKRLHVRIEDVDIHA